MKEIGSFEITAAESADFARASGDFNPLHLDPVAARRTQFGRTLIHGVFGTLRALDLLLAQEKPATGLRSLRVKYPRPAGQGDTLTVLVERDGSLARVELHARGVRCQVIDVELTADTADDSPLPAAPAEPADCADLAVGDADGLSGAVPLRGGTALLKTLLPHATRALSPAQLASVLACTEIVGMRCPGLHSVFAQLQLTFEALDQAATSTLEFQVTRADPRIDRVEMNVGNASVRGTIEAFFRPRPARQATMDEVAGSVAAGEFRHQNALVIGASRGLGEVIAKVLGAGGGRLLLTWASGMEDAERVAAEIGTHTGTPATTRYDVLQGSGDTTLAEFLADATHLYYLASPLIDKGEPGNWNEELFQRYRDYYIGGLEKLLGLVDAQRTSDHPLTLFIPSSVFLQEKVRGFEEYIAAKTEAEQFAQDATRSRPGLTVVAPRLPRLHTDQTSGVRGGGEGETLAVIAGVLRENVGAGPQPAED